MQKVFFLAALLVIGCTSNAQKIKQENVPANVMQAFNKMYPDILSCKWKLDEGKYEAHFKKNNEEVEAEFSNDGKFIQTEKELSSVNDLSPEVIASLKKDFAGYKFEDAVKIETAESKIMYELEAEQGETEYELVYDSKGTLQKKTQKKEDDKEGKEKKEKHEHEKE